MEAIAIYSPTAKSVSPRRGMRLSAIAGEVIRLLLASVLLFAGLAKLRSPYEFLISIYGYEMTGPLLSLLIATVLPWLEVFTAICLWGKLCYRGALAMAILLFLMFTTVVGIALCKQLDISCGCFIAPDKIGYSTFLRSVSLLAASAIGLMLAIRGESNPRNV